MNRFREVCLGFCFCFVTVSLFSQTVVSIQPDHECRGADCPVCLMIQRTENFFRQLGNAVFHAGVPAAMTLISAFILKQVFFAAVPLSAVQLKVKINR